MFFSADSISSTSSGLPKLLHHDGSGQLASAAGVEASACFQPAGIACSGSGGAAIVAQPARLAIMTAAATTLLATRLPSIALPPSAFHLALSCLTPLKAPRPDPSATPCAQAGSRTSSPVRNALPNAATTGVTEYSTGWPSRCAIHAASRPPATPSTPPIEHTTSASVLNCSMMFIRRAPVAMRMPISRTRSVTDTSMMFMTPMPPTTSEIAAIEPSSRVSVFWVSDAVSRIEAMLRIWKSVLRWRAVSIASIAACVSSMRVASATCTVMARTKRRPKSRIWPVVSGTKTASSMSPPKEVAPFARQHADDLERHVVDEQVLPDGVRVPEHVVGDGGAEHDHRRVRLDVRPREERAAAHRPVAGERVGLARRRRARLVVGLAGAHGHAAAVLGHGMRDVGHLADRDRIVGHERGVVAGRADVAPARPDHEQIGAHRLDAREHLALAARADREHRDHRAHADDDAEQRQEGAEEIHAQRAQRHLRRFEEVGNEAERAALRERRDS